MELTRRNFIMGAAALGGIISGGTLLTACASSDAKKDDMQWDKETDVVVVGYGGAGAAAAITAHDAGAAVLILEKMSQGGGNTANSGGGFLSPNDSDGAYTYIKGLYEFSHSVYKDDLIRKFSDESVNNLDWFSSLNESVQTTIYGHAGFAEVKGAESMDKHCITPREGGKSDDFWAGVRGAQYFGVLSDSVELDRGIEVLLETPATRLITNAGGEVVGIAASSGGAEIAIKAKRGVILTTGGYEYNQEMLQNNVKGYPIYAAGSPGNTGDGILMAQAAGAELWHMNGTSAFLGFKADELDAGFSFQDFLPSMIWVDKHGKRFVNEKSVETHAGLLAVDFYDAIELEYPRIPSYRVFDEVGRNYGQVCASKNLNNYEWSKDNTAEIEKGWIVKADTIEELAGKIGIDPAELSATVATWNNSIEGGKDAEYGRAIGSVANTAYLEQASKDNVSAKIIEPPFYAIAQYPVLMNTQGGPLRNADAQVLSTTREPIPRLYSAGELGSMWGLIYQGSGNNGESLVFGRIAGAHAASLAPWDEA